MRPLEEVRAEVLSSMRPVESETIWFADGLGRVLAEPIVSPEDVPHFANSAMDGFAVRAADVTEPGAVLTVLQDVPAGQVATVAVGAGEAIKIMTGAPMPVGADAVVQVEVTSVEDGKVTIAPAVAVGNHVRAAGGDVTKGETVFPAGTRLTAMHVGVLATIGVVQPRVARRPRVALMSSGDELVAADTPALDPGMIRDSNRPMLAALLGGAGAEVVDYGPIPDDPDHLRAAIGRAVAETDAIVTSGGVSMGDYDVVKLVLRDEVGVDFMQVAMKPSKPFGFGKIGGRPFFGLPGNPVSAFVSFEQFVRPALLAMQGAAALLRPQVLGLAGENLDTDPEKTVFLRVRLRPHGGRLVASLAGSQDSNVLSATANADAFAVVPRRIGAVAEGEEVILELFNSSEMRATDDS